MPGRGQREHVAPRQRDWDGWIRPTQLPHSGRALVVDLCTAGSLRFEFALSLSHVRDHIGFVRLRRRKRLKSLRKQRFETLFAPKNLLERGAKIATRIDAKFRHVVISVNASAARCAYFSLPTKY